MEKSLDSQLNRQAEHQARMRELERDYLNNMEAYTKVVEDIYRKQSEVMKPVENVVESNVEWRKGEGMGMEVVGKKTTIISPTYPAEMMKRFQEIAPTFSPERELEGMDVSGVEEKLDVMIELMKAGKSPAILR
jgi:hypothetical protein